MGVEGIGERWGSQRERERNGVGGRERDDDE